MEGGDLFLTNERAEIHRQWVIEKPQKRPPRHDIGLVRELWAGKAGNELSG